MKKIELASLGKRALAAVIDLVIFLALEVGLFALCSTIFLSNDYSRNLQKEIQGYEVASGLYYRGEDGNNAVYDFATYDSYQQVVVAYYTVYLAANCPEGNRHPDYTVYWYNVHILGLADSRGLYDEKDLSARLEPSLTAGPTLFAYGSSLDEAGVPAASLYENGQLTDAGKTSLLTFYYSSTQRSAYYNAQENLYNSPFYQQDYQLYLGQERTYPLITSVPISSLLYYLLIPLLFADGETLGKKAFKLCLVSKLGYSVKKGQVALRQLPSPLFAELFFVLLNPAPAVTLISGVLLVSYMFVIFDKQHRALHDFWAGTLVVDKQASLFYPDAHAQELGEAQFQAAEKEGKALRQEIEAPLPETKKD